MNKVSDILKYLTEIAPIENALDFDNVGLLLGKNEDECNKLILTLDISEAVVAEAVKNGADLIISHHPIIFRPVNRLIYDEPQGRKIIELIKNKISVISMHTNLDAAVDGVNKALADKLLIKPESYLNSDTNIGLVGTHLKCRFEDFLRKVSAELECKALRFQKSKDFVEKLAICGGSGGDEILNAKRHGCDTYLTSEIKHHMWIEAKELEINLIDAGHFETENVIMLKLEQKLKEKFPNIDVTIAKSNKNPVSYFLNSSL